MKTLLNLISSTKTNVVFFGESFICLAGALELGGVDVYIPNQTEYRNFSVMKQNFKHLRNGHIPASARQELEAGFVEKNFEEKMKSINKSNASVLYAYEVAEAINGFMKNVDLMKPNMMQVLAEVGNNKIQYVSTDGYSLMIKTAKCIWNKPFSVQLPYVLAGAVKTLVETDRNRYSEISRVELYEEYALFKDVHIFHSLGKFPDYRAVIPQTEFTEQILICEQNLPYFKKGIISFGINGNVYMTNLESEEIFVENTKHFVKSTGAFPHISFSIQRTREIMKETKSLWVKIHAFGQHKICKVETSNPNVEVYTMPAEMKDVEDKLNPVSKTESES